MAAAIASKPAIANALIERAKRTPYANIYGPDGSLYMSRWWLFNPYFKDEQGHQLPGKFHNLPNIRIHHIVRPDTDRHEHDHPWDAQTIILKGWYKEERRTAGLPDRILRAGDTSEIKFGNYHRIVELSPGGVYTLFITFSHEGKWGYNVDGVKVPWNKYGDL